MSFAFPMTSFRQPSINRTINQSINWSRNSYANKRKYIQTYRAAHKGARFSCSVNYFSGMFGMPGVVNNLQHEASCRLPGRSTQTQSNEWSQFPSRSRKDKSASAREKQEGGGGGGGSWLMGETRRRLEVGGNWRHYLLPILCWHTTFN